MLSQDDLEFEMLLAEKKHQELILSINTLVNSLALKEDISQPLVDAIQSSNISLRDFLMRLQSTLVPDKTLVIVAQQIHSEIIQSNQLLVKLLQERSKEREVHFTRDNMGYIKSPITII